MHTSKLKIVGQNVLLAVIAIIPILFLPLSLISLEPLKTFLILITGVVFALGVLIHKIKQDSFFVTKNGLVLSIGGILVSSLVSSIFSNNAVVSLFGRQISATSFFGLLALCALAAAVYVFFDGVKEKTRLFLTTYVSSIVVVLVHALAVVLPFFPTLGFFVNNTINTVGRWYDLGFFSLFVALSSVLVLQFLRHSNFYKILGWAGLVLGLAVMILTNSIAVLIMGIIFSLLYVVLNAVAQYDPEGKGRISYEALIVLVVSIMFLLIGGKTSVLLDSFFQLNSQEVRPSISATYEISKHAIWNDPAVGIGTDRFDTAWLLYRPLGSNVTQFWDTDFRFGYSNIMSIPATQGIVGLIAWLLFIGLSVFYAFKLLFSKSQQKSDIFINLYSVLGYLFFLVVMLIYTPSIVLIGMTFVFLGLFLSNLKHAQLIAFRQVAINKSPRFSFVYILALVLLLIGFVYVGYIFVSQYASRVLFERATAEYNAAGDLQKLEASVARAQFVYNSDMYSRARTEIGMLAINNIVQDQNISQEQAVSQFTEVLRMTIGHAQAAIAYDQQSYANRLALVGVYKNLIPLGVADAKDEALKLLDDTEKLTPNNPTVALEKARIYTLAQEFDPAIEQIRRAVELKPNFVDAVFLLSQIQVEKGEIDQAVTSIQAAVQVDGYNPNLRFQLGLLKYNQQKYNDAIVSFEQAVILSPLFANAKYFLGLSYYYNNRTSDAIAVFENLNAQVPDNQEVQLILGNLKGGKDPFDGIQPPLDNRPEQRDELPVEDEETTSSDDASAE